MGVYGKKKWGVWMGPKQDRNHTRKTQNPIAPCPELEVHSDESSQGSTCPFPCLCYLRLRWPALGYVHGLQCSLADIPHHHHPHLTWVSTAAPASPSPLDLSDTASHDSSTYSLACRNLHDLIHFALCAPKTQPHEASAKISCQLEQLSSKLRW